MRKITRHTVEASGSLAVISLLSMIALAVLANNDIGAPHRELPCDHVHSGRLYYFIPTGEIAVAQRSSATHATIHLPGADGLVACKFLTTTSNVTIATEP